MPSLRFLCAFFDERLWPLPPRRYDVGGDLLLFPDVRSLAICDGLFDNSSWAFFLPSLGLTRSCSKDPVAGVFFSEAGRGTPTGHAAAVVIAAVVIVAVAVAVAVAVVGE